MNTMESAGIHCIDTGLQRPGFDAAWLVVENGRGAFIDCGTSHSVPRMLAALQAVGLTASDVDWVILTHVHLDHAGGAGELMSHLPQARLAVHPRGAPHMIDPSRLVASATTVYGEVEMARQYGRILPIDRDRVAIIDHGQSLSLAGRALWFEHTPGHASHHLCVWDEATRTWFTGDTFGLAYRELQGPEGAFILPSTSPTQFDPEQLSQSIHRLMARQPAAMHLTHYGTVFEPVRLAASLLEQIHDISAMAQEQRPGVNREQVLLDRLWEYWSTRAEQAGLDAALVREVLAIDVHLNAQGLVCWLERIQR